MRVLHLLDSVPRGGAETLVLDVCKAGAASGLDFSVVSFGGGDLESDFIQSGVDYTRLDRRLPIDPLCARQLWKIIQTKSVDVVHSHQSVDTLHAYIATRRSHVKRVRTFHGYPYDWKNRAIGRFMLPRVHANIVVSSSFLEQVRVIYQPRPNSHFVVLHNGVNPAKVERATPTLRKALGIEEGQVLAGMVANFYFGKDHMTVCAALPSILENLPTLKFVFVGARDAAHPQFYDNCVRFCRERGLEERVAFIGGRRDIGNVLASLDVFVLSSVEDTFGIAVVEAMMAGVPTVLSDIAPFIELSNQGRLAKLFKTGNSAELARVLVLLLQNRVEQDRLRREARIHALAEYSIARHVDRLKDLYESLCAA